MSSQGDYGRRTMSEAPTTIDEYVATFDGETREILGKVAAAMRRALPGAEERIRFGMPAFMFEGRRYGVHFAGWKTHVGIYPVARLDEPLEAEVATHRTGKDTVRFTYREGVPYELVERIVAALAERSTPAD
jgi:uncharacterized protein YdhG (YjbR/CyaY superfamily)